MSIINPEMGAIPRYLWDIAQDGIKEILEEVSTAQAAINSEYEFLVENDRYRPTLESLVKENHLVNIYVGAVRSDDAETNFAKNHVVTYNIDCYVQGFDEDDPTTGNLVPADEAAVQRLKYLCAMVEFGLTKLANFFMKLPANNIWPDKIDLTYNPVDDAAESGTPYAPARFQFVCKFPYVPQDLELPELTEINVTLEDWALKIFP